LFPYFAVIFASGINPVAKGEVRLPSGLCLRNDTQFGNTSSARAVVWLLNYKTILTCKTDSYAGPSFDVMVDLARDSPLLDPITDVPFLHSAPGAIVSS
jgi:hypothetical protein